MERLYSFISKIVRLFRGVITLWTEIYIAERGVDMKKLLLSALMCAIFCTANQAMAQRGGHGSSHGGHGSFHGGQGSFHGGQGFEHRGGFHGYYPYYNRYYNYAPYYYSPYYYSYPYYYPYYYPQTYYYPYYSYPYPDYDYNYDQDNY